MLLFVFPVGGTWLTRGWFLWPGKLLWSWLEDFSPSRLSASLQEDNELTERLQNAYKDTLNSTPLIHLRHSEKPHRHLLAVTAACPLWRTSGGPERTGSYHSKLAAPFQSPRCICDTLREAACKTSWFTKRVYCKCLSYCFRLSWSTNLLYSAPLKRLSGFLHTLHSMKRIRRLELRAAARSGGSAVGFYLIPETLGLGSASPFTDAKKPVGELLSTPPKRGRRWLTDTCSMNEVPYLRKYHHSNIWSGGNINRDMFQCFKQQMRSHHWTGTKEMSWTNCNSSDRIPVCVPPLEWHLTAIISSIARLRKICTHF